MKLVFTSDTHMQMLDMDFPDGDVLIHCGDALSYGREKEFYQFAKDLGKLATKYDHILYTPGNHDQCVQFGLGPAQARQVLASESASIEMLLHESYRLEWMGEVIKFFGSPWTPRFGNWAYMYPRSEGGSLWADIPPDTDVVFTHGMPYGILDQVWRIMADEDDDHVGCGALRDRLDVVRPKVFAGGHLHMQGGQTVVHNGTLYINAAMCTDAYKAERPPIVVDTVDWKVCA